MKGYLHKYSCLVMLLPISITSCKTSKPEAKSLLQVEWLAGTWERVNSRQVIFQEQWTKVGDGSWTGRGLQIAGTDTVIFELLKIVEENDNYFYVADVPENKEPTFFKFTEIAGLGFTCENPDHDFPKVIKYQLEGSDLKVVISGNGEQREFRFYRKKVK